MIISIHSWKRDNPRLTYEVNVTIFFYSLCHAHDSEDECEYSSEDLYTAIKKQYCNGPNRFDKLRILILK
jgi:hypothetical protein